MKRLIPLVVGAVTLVACSPTPEPVGETTTTSVVSPVTVPEVTTTVVTEITTTTTVPTHAIAYPNVPISVREMAADETSYAIWTRSDQEQDKSLPEFVYGNDFTPTNMDLDPPRPVRFTNSTDDDIVIIFSSADIADLPLGAGGSDIVDFTDRPEDVYRFHVFRGNAKITGFLDLRSAESSIEPDPDETVVRQSPFNGMFSIAVPRVSPWYFDPQYDSIVAVPVGDDWPQGDFQWSMISGAPLHSSGMRLRYVESDDPDSVLEDPVVPENCTFVATEAMQISGLEGMQSEYECEVATLLLGYLETDGGYLVLAIADAPADPTDVILAALDTIELHPDGSGEPLTERGSPVHHSFSWPIDIGGPFLRDEMEEEYPIDIEGGAVGPELMATLSVLSPTVVEIRNFDDVEYTVEIDGQTVVQLAPRHAVSFDLLDIGEEQIHLTVSFAPFAGLGLSLDLTEREPEPAETMYSDTGRVNLEMTSVELGDRAEAQGVAGLMVPVPEGWSDIGEHRYWNYRYVRRAAADDPAEVELDVAASISTPYLLGRISTAVRALPEEIDRVLIRGDEWIVYQWVPEGHPTVTLMTLESEGMVVMYGMVTSSPEDHWALYDQVLVPMVSDFYGIPTD